MAVLTAQVAWWSSLVQGAVGDGKANDTAAIQAAIDASIGKGIAYAPANGTHLLGGGLKFIGHSYDGKGQRFVERHVGPKALRWTQVCACALTRRSS